MDAKRALDDLNALLEASGRERRVTFARRASRAEVTAAEKALGVALPPSYVKLVTTHGAFEISGDLTGNGDGNDTKLFTPSEVVKQTQRYRRELAKSRDEDSKEILADGILFCADPLDEYFHLFVVSSKDKRGEMKTRGYDYQDPANNDGWLRGDGSLGTVVDAIIARVVENEGLEQTAKPAKGKSKAAKPAVKEALGQKRLVRTLDGEATSLHDAAGKAATYSVWVVADCEACHATIVELATHVGAVRKVGGALVVVTAGEKLGKRFAELGLPTVLADDAFHTAIRADDASWTGSGKIAFERDAVVQTTYASHGKWPRHLRCDVRSELRG